MKNKDSGYEFLKNSDEKENCFGNFGKEYVKNDYTDKNMKTDSD